MKRYPVRTCLTLTYISVLALFVLTVGCTGATLVTPQPSPSISVTPTLSTTRSEFTLPSVTPDPTCLPPCFYTIEPGETAITDAFRLLGATTLQFGDQNDGALIWKTKPPAREWYAKSTFLENRISFIRGVVNSIQLYEKQDITLQSIVSKYGDPEAVAVGRPAGPLSLFDTILLYPTKGLAFIGTWSPQSDTRTEVYTPHPETLVDSEIYFAPMNFTMLSVDDVNKWRATYVTDIYPWPGFGNLIEPH